MITKLKRSNLLLNMIIVMTSINQVSSAELTVAKFFSSGMVLQEAPASANIFGSCQDGWMYEVRVILQCQDGREEEYQTSVVRIV